jgi:nucleoid-associated protein YgaU
MAKLAGVFVLLSTLALSGCVARTYNLTRDRVDQDLSSSSGNRGYLMGTAPEPGERAATRTTRVFEIELGRSKKADLKCPSTVAPLAAERYAEEPLMAHDEVLPEQTEGLSFEKYTVAKNDTLQKISMKFYGTTKKWNKIYEANKNTLRAPDKLYPGQVINIPSIAGLKAGADKMEEPKENLK